MITITSARAILERRMSDISEGIVPQAVPSGTGCVECLAADQWWLHLRRCAKCGHIGCCDTSPNQHATAHFRDTGHFIMTSFEPGENWFWNYRTGKPFYGAKLALPRSRPLDQPTPGPKGACPGELGAVPQRVRKRAAVPIARNEVHGRKNRCIIRWSRSA